MAYADRLGLLIALLWAAAVFVLTGGTQRPDLAAGEHAGILLIAFAIPSLAFWLALRIAFGSAGARR